MSNCRCKHHRVRSKKYIKYFYCTELKKEITNADCVNCTSYDKKEVKTSNYTDKKKYVLKRTKTPLKRVSTKQAKTEKNRFSILVNDLNVCAVCGSKYNIAKHEIYWGKNRQNSMKYGLVIGLCKKEHHTIGKFAIHNNKKLNEYWRGIARKRFIEIYPDLDFTEIFKSK